MKIAFLVSGDLPSTSAHSLQAFQMATAIGRLGHAVRLFAPESLRLRLRRARGGMDFYGRAGRVEMERIPCGPPWRTTFFSGWGARALEVVRRYAPDLVYARDYDSPTETIRAGIPTIVEKHSPLLAGNGIERLFGLADRPAFRSLVVVTRALADVHRNGGFPVGKIVVEPDGVDLSLFGEPGPVPAAGPVVYAGSLAVWKGIGTLLEAARSLPEVPFDIVGGGAFDRLGWRLRGVPRNVRFLRRVAHAAVPAILVRARALVLPNSGEGVSGPYTSPLKLFEYMAAGRPVVATDIPPLREVLRHGENAWIVPPNDPAAMTDGIRRVLDDRALAERISVCARAEVSRYAWEGRSRRILECFSA
ncbi:MAG: glycosyltransferase family 4 protein [Planctomycetes bacterium]|nr:glycosyltransferase family 4 protein [Planctomycetota bacterium]